MKIAVAGTTANTVHCTQALAANPQFEISLIITPQPRAKGRKKIITPNPLHQFAQKKNIPAVLVNKKIDPKIQAAVEAEIKKNGCPDILLVVDFGYIVPDWLLKIPKIAPINIHPSILPAWRGSSPGQFSLLTGAKQSAVSVIKINDKLDQGDIIHQEYFKIEENWTQTEYYQTSFKLISLVLAEILNRFNLGKIQVKKQPAASPTPIAKRLSKQDAFIEWTDIKSLIDGQKISVNKVDNKSVKSLLKYAIPKLQKISAQHFVQAVYAMRPWPVCWTFIPTAKGNKRMKILAVGLDKSDGLEKLTLETVQIEGQSQAKWAQVKNIVLS